MHGLWSALARQHDLTSVALADPEFDLDECRAAMGRYSQEVLLLPNPRGRDGAMKRALQLRSLASLHSFERHRVEVPALQRALDQLLRARHFDVVNVEFPYLAHLRLRQAPPGTRPPAVVVDSHEIAHEMVRQFAASSTGLGRTVYSSLNWRKLRHEELAAYRSADGVAVCSVADRERVLRDVPSARTAVVPNAADVEHYRPRSGDPAPDGRTVLFFGLLSTLPNIDGLPGSSGRSGPASPGSGPTPGWRSSARARRPRWRRWPGRASRSRDSSRTSGRIWPPPRRSWCRSGWAVAPG